MDQLFGYIERIVFQNSENGFTVARLQQPRKSELTTIVGMLSILQPGENVRLLGNWKQDPKHGMQFDVVEWHSEAPSDLAGIQKYLESGLIKGIGPIYAERIVKHFGLRTLEIIDQNPNALLKVPGIGKKRMEEILKSWQEHRTIREVMLFLQKYDVSPAYAYKIYRIYGNETVERMQSNPFHLAEHIPGIGFKMADKIADKMGFPKNGSQRIESGIEYLFSELSGDGHTCYPLTEFLEKTEEILNVLAHERLDHLIEKGEIIKAKIDDIEYVWMKRLWLCEQGIGKQLERIRGGKCRLRPIDVEKAIIWAEKELSIELALNQKEAVKCSLEEKIHIITGGPGTGKSTITKAILAVTAKLSNQIILAAPTGRAAKRMSEITGKKASTIHSLLQFDFNTGKFKYDLENPLICDLIIIDEASMIDTGLMYHLLKAIPHHARLILVGDIHQLPSVGPGNVLKDLIESETLSVTRLNEIFRQAAGSRITTNAHLINQGEFPNLSIEKKSDFFFVKGSEPEEVLEKVLMLVSERLPKFYRFNSFDQIQVLTPMKKGIIGTENLNRALQEKLNPQKEGLNVRGFRFSVGDKVMQIRNNYKKEVYNGDIGRIRKIDLEQQEITVQFDDHFVHYLIHELDELVLAYATSVHKSQGSECPCVVIPVHTTHFMMLRRNLLYTAVTRGKKLVVLVGTGKAIAIAVSNDDVKKRHTALKNVLLSLK